MKELLMIYINENIIQYNIQVTMVNYTTYLSGETFFHFNFNREINRFSTLSDDITCIIRPILKIVGYDTPYIILHGQLCSDEN